MPYPLRIDTIDLQELSDGIKKLEVYLESVNQNNNKIPPDQKRA
jgi:hypothetical protein